MLLVLLRYVNFMHTYTRKQIECMVDNYHLVWRNVITTFHLNFILLSSALFVPQFIDEVNVIYFAPCACLYYALVHLAAAELELDISGVDFLRAMLPSWRCYTFMCV